LAIESVGLTLAALTAAQVAEVAQRAAHVREVLTGNPDGTPGTVSDSLGERLQARATELDIAVRTLERWLAACRRDGEAGLVDTGTLRGRGSGVDPRWDDAVRVVLADKVSASTPTLSAVLAAVEQRLDDVQGWCRDRGGRPRTGGGGVDERH
jgi:hypothetical protein